jgi:PIN domain nuclease of toxin-antitoxin system
VGAVRVLLDTCAFIWLALNPARLSTAATGVINDPGNELLLSDVSVWEIVLKHTAGKLALPDAPRLWVPTRRAFFQLHPLPVAEAALFRSGELPKIHPDPFDRLLAAQAIEADLTVLTPDLPFERLGAQRVW